MESHSVDGGEDDADHSSARSDVHELSDPVLVEAVEMRKSLRRRSSMSVVQLAPMETTFTSVAKPLTLVAGDQVVRPHFLKDRSTTMHDRLAHSPSVPNSTSTHQSKASSFLVSLVEKSRSSSSASTPTSAMTSARPQSDPQDGSSGLQWRRQNVVITNSQANKLVRGPLQRMGPPQLPSARTSIHTIHSGCSHLASHVEDEQEYVADAELLERPRSQLVRDLSLYLKQSTALVRILTELRRRLEAAVFDGADHGELCRELVDDGLLAAVVLAMREFCFHAALQTAAIALLSVVADASDLYALLMSELDVEPLIHKIVAVHVADERLVMDGSSLVRAIAGRKHKRHVVQMHKAWQLEQERQRAASFGQAFAAERKSSKARALLDAESGKTLVSLQIMAQAYRGRPASRSQRRTLSDKLGEPPLLTAHYDLEVSFFTPEATSIPPLERQSRSNDNDAINELPVDDPAAWKRPITSPDLRRPRSQPLGSKTSAIYSKSPVFVAPSPLRTRIQASRKSHSADASGIRRLVSRRHCRGKLPSAARTNGISTGSTLRDRTQEVSNRSQDDDGDGAGSLYGDSGEDQLVNHKDPTAMPEEEEDNDKESDDDPSYDDEDFVLEDDCHGNDKREDRLLPIESDSDLFELVERSELGCEEAEHHDDSSNLVHSHAPHDQAHADPESPNSSNPQGSARLNEGAHDDPVTTEIVGLLSACLDSFNPTSAFLSTLETGSRPSSDVLTPQSTKNRTQRPVTAVSPAVSSWALPSTVVRPVSRRILDQTLKTTAKKRAASPSSPQDPSAAQTTVQLTAILGTIHQPESKDQAADAHSGEDHLRPASPSTAIAQIKALYARGLQHHKANQLDDAARCYQQAIHLQHTSGAAREFASLYINLGSARLAQRRPLDALAAFAQAERVQPRNLKALFNSALARMQLAQWPEALAVLDQVLLLDASHGRAQYAREQCRRMVDTPGAPRVQLRPSELL